MSDEGLRLALTPAEQQRAQRVSQLRDAGAAGVEALVDMLTDPSWAVRREVVGALGAIGKPAVGALCEVLRSRREDESRLAAAVDALALTGADVLEPVLALAGSGQHAAIADAAQILGRRRDARATPELARLASHPNDNVAIAAIEALGRIGGRLAVDALLAAVKSGSFFRVFPAIDILGRSRDPRAVPALAALLPDATYALEAARALGRFGEASAVAPLAALLAHRSEAVVRIAATSLTKLLEHHADRYGTDEAAAVALRRASPGDVAVRQLVQGLGTANDDERIAIARLLGVLGGERAMGALGRLLDAGDEVGRAAAAALLRIGPQSDRALRAALREGSSARRAVILPALSRSTAAADVMACLEDADPAVRALACEALARLGATGTVPKLFTLLGDPDERVRQATIAAIQSLGSGDTKRFALAAAESEDSVVRRSALRIVSYFGFTEALPSFLSALHQDRDERLRDAAIAGLAFLEDPRALEALLAAARENPRRTRGAAIRALGQTPTEDPRVVAALLSALRDPDAWVRYYAVQAVGRRRVESATETIAGLLSDSAGQVRVGAVEALSHFQNPKAIAALRAAAEGEDDDLKRAALIGLGIAKRSEGFPVLAAAAASRDPATRLVAISAIVDSTSPDAVPVLARAARDPDDNVRSAAIGFLGALPGRDATEALVALAREREDRDPIVSVLALPAEGRVEALASALERADDELAPILTSALARLKTPPAVAALIETLARRPAPARKAAATALAAIRTPSAIDALHGAAMDDPDPAVRDTCAVLLTE